MILLDTHVVVHYVQGERTLGKRAVTTIDRALERDELFVSALSFWARSRSLPVSYRLHTATRPTV